MKGVKRKTPNLRLRDPSKFGENFLDIIHAVKSELEIKQYFNLVKSRSISVEVRGERDKYMSMEISFLKLVNII